MQRISNVGINALFLDPNRSAGPESYLRGLVPALATEFPDVRFHVATTRRGARALRADGWDDICSITTMRCDEGQRLHRLWAEQLSLPILARRLNWDLLHSLASLAPIRTPVPAVITVHDVTFFHHKTFSPLTTFTFQQITKRSVRNAAGLFTASEAAKAEIVETLGLQPDRLAVVPHGPGKSAQPSGISEKAIRARFAIGDDDRVVLCVAAVRPHKNQRVLVEAAERAGKRLRWLFVGPLEPYADDLERYVVKNGLENRVSFLGYVSEDDLNALWGIADCAAFPTLAEGFGLPVLEALGRGVPVACSDIPVLREVGGELPKYFDPHDPVSAAQAVQGLIEKPPSADVLRQRAQAFSWQKAAQQTFEVYERAVAERVSA